MAQGALDDVNLFVKYLPSNMDDGGLRALFSSHGQVLSAKVMVDHNTGASLGFGYAQFHTRFVRFSLPEQAQTAVQNMCGFRIANKTLEIRAP